MRTKMLLAGLVALPFAASAADFDYTYVEGGYMSSSTDMGPFNVNGDGLGVRGSLGLNETFNLFADYTTYDMDFGVDSSSYELGVGGHWGIKDDLDFIGELAWVGAEVSQGPVSVSDDGFGLGAGLRFRATDKVELQGMLNYVNLDNSDTSLGLAGRYYLSNAFAIGAGLLLNDGDTTWNVGVRAEFSGR